MKHLIFLSLTLLTISASAQWGIKIGINNSFYLNGDQTYTGLQHSYQSFTGGIYKAWYNVKAELNWQQQGSKHPNERNSNGDKRTFKATYISLPVTYVIHCGDATLEAGAYGAKLIGAKNYDLYTDGPNFSWSTRNWKWYQAYDWGFVAGIGYKWHPVTFSLRGTLGMHDVRQYDFDNQGEYDPARQGNHNASLQFSAYVPFNLK